jgi:hypothetical protein
LPFSFLHLLRQRGGGKGTDLRWKRMSTAKRTSPLFIQFFFLGLLCSLPRQGVDRRRCLSVILPGFLVSPRLGPLALASLSAAA